MAPKMMDTEFVDTTDYMSESICDLLAEMSEGILDSSSCYVSHHLLRECFMVGSC